MYIKSLRTGVVVQSEDRDEWGNMTELLYPMGPATNKFIELAVREACRKRKLKR